MTASTLDAWAAQGRLRTVLMDGVKKVSVTDVICASKKCSRCTAHNTYARLVTSGKLAPIALSKCPTNEGRRGGAHTPIPFASAEEVVQLLHALPGAQSNAIRVLCARRSLALYVKRVSLKRSQIG